MCDNAAKTIRSNYLKHIARPGTKTLWERACSRKRCVSRYQFRLTRPLREQAPAPTGSACIRYRCVVLKRGNATVHGQ